jgi:hypothetical protein
MKNKLFMLFISIGIRSWCSAPAVTTYTLQSAVRDNHFVPAQSSAQSSLNSLNSSNQVPVLSESQTQNAQTGVGSSQHLLTANHSELLKSQSLALDVERSHLSLENGTQKAEIARLRAEVNRLTTINAALTRQSPSVDAQQVITELKALRLAEHKRVQQAIRDRDTLNSQLQQCTKERDFFDAKLAKRTGERDVLWHRNKALEFIQQSMRAEKDGYLREKVDDYRAICALKLRNAALHFLCRIQNQTIKKLKAHTFVPVLAPKATKPGSGPQKASGAARAAQSAAGK